LRQRRPVCAKSLAFDPAQMFPRIDGAKFVHRHVSFNGNDLNQQLAAYHFTEQT
jgi:hypothetical protein